MIISKSNTPYGQLYYYENDAFIANLLRYNEMWDEELILNHLASIIKDSSSILDIGAHVGSHSVMYKFLNPSLEIHAFELQTMMYELLKKNIHINSLKNIHSFNCAVGHRVRTITIDNLITDGPNSYKKYSYHDGQDYNFGGISLGYGEVEQLMITIDSLKLKSCDFIKIDVEGSETLVLMGAIETIEKYRPAIFFEENYKQTNEYISSLINEDLGLDKLPTPSDFLRDLGYSNILCVDGYDNILALWE